MRSTRKKKLLCKIVDLSESLCKATSIVTDSVDEFIKGIQINQNASDSWCVQSVFKFVPSQYYQTLENQNICRNSHPK